MFSHILKMDSWHQTRNVCGIEIFTYGTLTFIPVHFLTETCSSSRAVLNCSQSEQAKSTIARSAPLARAKFARNSAIAQMMTSSF